MKLLSWLPRAYYLYFLRSVFISSVALWVIFFIVWNEVGMPLRWSLLFSSILLNQVACAFTFRFLHTITNLIWLMGNISILILYSRLEITSTDISPWSNQLIVFHGVLCYYLMGALPLLALIRLGFVFDYGFRTLFQPFDLLSHLQPGKNHDHKEGLRMLFGNSIWRSHFTGETKKLIFARGSLAVLFLSSIAVFSLLRTLAEPIRELRLIPTQIIRTPDTNTPIQGSDSDAATWGVVITSGPSTGFLYRSAVSVKPLWNNDTNSGNDIFPQPYSEFQPDLLVTVNFTKLGIPIDVITDIPANSVQVMIAMTNKTDDVVLMTVPITLIPGANLIGMASMEIHQTFKNPGLSIFGLFESTQSTVMAQIIHVFSDPQAGIAPLIVRSPEIATIRISVQLDSSQWTVIQDSKEKSFLNGLSQTGGLWTFLSGIFAFVFGSSLGRILFGTKPVSVFGFAHSWERQTIQKAYREEYPAVAEEIGVPQDQRGLLCLLQDHIIDLNLIEESKQDFSAIPMDVELEDVERGPGATREDHTPMGEQNRPD